MTRVLVTGAGGQLGQSIMQLAPNFSEIDFIFRTARELDITDPEQITREFESGEFQYCINCAAYTNVEMAEKDPTEAFRVNDIAVLNLAQTCKKYDTVLLHISTDYVFDGTKETAYTISDIPNPINQYGRSKWEGEIRIQESMEHYFIVRTSWLYSEFGNNFYKTILRKAKAGEEIYVTDTQRGCPTNAIDLASFLISIIHKNYQEFGVYHFTGGEAMTWYGFAQKIVEDHQLQAIVELATDDNYRSFAARPTNSVLLSNVPDNL